MMWLTEIECCGGRVNIMSSNLNLAFDALIEKYAEFITGDGTPEMVEKIKRWAVYQHISKSMPPLTKHWGEMHPDARAEVRALFTEIKMLNERLNAQRGGATNDQN
jgi:hypothetical protein